MTIGPVLLLTAPSRESRDKAAHFADAAEALGFPSQILELPTQEHIMAIGAEGAYAYALACSDALVAAAAMLNQARGCSVVQAGLAMALVDKASGVPLLSALLDLQPLPQCVPCTPAAMLAWPHAGPLIVKPTRSSGGWSPQPWGYRRFDNAAAFLAWLASENLAESFFAEQRRPGPLGPALLQAAIDTAEVETAGILLGAAGAAIYCQGRCWFEADGAAGHGRRWTRVFYGAEAAPDLTARLPRLYDLVDRGSGQGILHVQGIRAPTGFHIIDINLRLSTGWDWLMAAADATFHRRMLASLVLGEPFDPVWPAPAMAIDLIHAPPGCRIDRIRYPSCDPYIRPWRLDIAGRASSDPGFDKAGQAPSFVTFGAGAADCIHRADAFRASLVIESRPEPAS